MGTSNINLAADLIHLGYTDAYNQSFPRRPPPSRITDISPRLEALFVSRWEAERDADRAYWKLTVDRMRQDLVLAGNIEGYRNSFPPGSQNRQVPDEQMETYRTEIAQYRTAMGDFVAFEEPELEINPDYEPINRKTMVDYNLPVDFIKQEPREPIERNQSWYTTDDKACNICLNDNFEDEIITYTRCGHNICNTCMVSLRPHATECPTCRKALLHGDL